MIQAEVHQQVSATVRGGLFDGDGNDCHGEITVTPDTVRCDDPPARGNGLTMEVLVISLNGTPRDNEVIETSTESPDETAGGRIREWTEDDYGNGGWPLLDPDDLRIVIPVTTIREVLDIWS